MPDNDIVPRRLGRHWTRAFRAALHGVNAAEVGDEIRAAVAAALRDAHGCPDVDRLARGARDAAVYGDWGAWERVVQSFLIANGRSAVSLTMVREAEGLLASDRDGLALMSDQQASLTVAEGGLRRWVDERMWGRGHDLLLERFVEFDAVRQFELAATAQASLPELAERLLARPDGDGLRAPQRKVRPRPTSVLLDEELG